ncbi:hypothetical protein AAFF_G00169070 [Aldrovandia affinis]|uniref:Uncharacterized protein n=1 Tax=Aldrovandia affinis TaxID=143900 RepID=A0AAD7RLN0_9TELE|nr:hypothetical protein AAFF_G00169070 [Aldrovandia affinis]
MQAEEAEKVESSGDLYFVCASFLITTLTTITDATPARDSFPPALDSRSDSNPPDSAWSRGPVTLRLIRSERELCGRGGISALRQHRNEFRTLKPRFELGGVGRVEWEWDER